MDNKEKTQFIHHINEIVREAIMHGGDPGGPYYCNREGLENKLNDFLISFGLDKEFEIKWEYPKDDGGIPTIIPSTVDSLMSYLKNKEE